MTRIRTRIYCVFRTIFSTDKYFISLYILNWLFVVKEKMYPNCEIKTQLFMHYLN